MVPRARFGQTVSDELESGYLYVSDESPWTGEPEDVVDRVPADWIEIHRGHRRVKSNNRKYVPDVMRLRPDGQQDTKAYPWLSSQRRFASA
ncbi:MAG: hypothetical protein ACOC7K_01870 [bacterium]